MDIDLRSELEEVIASEGYNGALGYFITCPDREEVAALCDQLRAEAYDQRKAAGYDAWSAPSLDKLAYDTRVWGMLILSERLAGRHRACDLAALDRAVEAVTAGRIRDARLAYDKALYP